MRGTLRPMSTHIIRERPLIAFFDCHDVFEDFYPHYGVDQKSFATRWADTANHAWLSLVQRHIGDVIWYMFSLAPELAEAQHEVVGCRVKFLPVSWLHRCLWRAFYLPRMAWRWRRAYRVYATVASYIALVSLPFFRTLLYDRPDCFFVQDYATGRFDVLLLIAWLLGVPLVAFHSGSRPERYLGRIVKRWTIPRANWLFPSGRHELETLASRYRVPRQRLTVIRPPVDTTVFRPLDRIAACRAAGLAPTRRYVLFVGRLDDGVKRVSAIIGAFAAVAVTHRDTDLVIVGDGSDRDRLQALAMEQIPDRAHFLGWISEPKAKVQVYNAAECLVLASWREASPAVISEAFACGTPVIASQVGAIGDLVVDGQTGWLFPPGDDEALAAALSFALTHPEVIASMRPRVREFAETDVSPAAMTAALQKGFSAVGRHHG
jgi:glycosyltransferase involved in cell wall biosynthesis